MHKEKSGGWCTPVIPESWETEAKNGKFEPSPGNSVN